MDADGSSRFRNSNERYLSFHPELAAHVCSTDLNALAKTRVQVPDGSVKKIVKDFYRLARADVQGDERFVSYLPFFAGLPLRRTETRVSCDA